MLNRKHKDILLELVNHKLSIYINQLNRSMVIRDINSLVTIEYKQDMDRLSHNIRILNEIKQELEKLI